MPTRRRFLKTTMLGTAAAVLAPAYARAAARTHKIGHTGITWGYGAERAEQAIKDVASLGYQAFESFGSILEYWEDRGGLGAHLEAAGLPLVAAYCPMILTDAQQRSGEVEKIVRWGGLIKKYGGRVAVLGPDPVDRDTFDFLGTRGDIVATLNDLGLALNDLGLVGALHPHTGTCVSTRDETYAVMEAVNTDYVKLCPDTGELLKAGADPVQTVKDLLPVIGHVHLKDYNGGEFNDGYCPVGTGRVDMAAVIDVLDTSDHDFTIMAELNPNPDNLPHPPLELARMSKAFFEEMGYEFD